MFKWLLSVRAFIWYQNINEKSNILEKLLRIWPKSQAETSKIELLIKKKVCTVNSTEFVVRQALLRLCFAVVYPPPSTNLCHMRERQIKKKTKKLLFPTCLVNIDTMKITKSFHMRYMYQSTLKKEVVSYASFKETHKEMKSCFICVLLRKHIRKRKVLSYASFKETHKKKKWLVTKWQIYEQRLNLRRS